MNTDQIVASINERIAALNTAKVLLADEFAEPATKRTMSPEGRKRIAEGQKKRWAKQRKAA